MRRIAGLLVVAMLPLVIAFCSCNSKNGKRKQTVKIGAPLPLTGDGAEYGANARKAIDLAVEEINAAGGVAGRKMAVQYEDTRLQPKDAVAAVTKLLTVDKVDVIVGAMASSEVEAVLPVCEENQIVLVSPSATAHKLSGASKYFFRTIASDVYEGEVMAKFAYEEKSYRKVGLFYIESAGPFGVSEAFRREFEKLGGSVPTVEKALQNATDLRTQLARMKGKSVDALFFAGFAKETATMLRQAKELALGLPVLAHQTAEAPEVRELAGSAADGVVFASGTIDPKGGDQSVKEFHEKFKKKYGADPQNYAANTYDAVMVVAEAMKQQGFDSASIIKGLSGVREYRGATGRLTFRENGDVEMPMQIMVIQDGKVVPYEKAP